MKRLDVTSYKVPSKVEDSGDYYPFEVCDVITSENQVEFDYTNITSKFIHLVISDVVTSFSVSIPSYARL